MSDKLFAYHVDLKRAMWRREYFDAMAARLADWGYNAIVCEIEDKFRFSNHPLLSHADAPTHEEYAALVRACRDRDIEVIPLMQSLGHVEFIVSRPEYAHLREQPSVTDQFDPTSDAARDLLIEIYDEIIDVMQPREYFHLGGDETWQLGRSDKCRPLVEKIGVGGLYLQFMLPLLQYVHRRGLRPMIWADICLSRPEIIAQVPDWVVMVDWEYSCGGERTETMRVWGGDRETGTLNRTYTWPEYQQVDRPEFREHLERYAVDQQTRRDGTFVGFYCTDALVDRGFDTITASANRCAGDMAGTPNNARHWPNCFYSARKGMRVGRGNLVTSWTVRHNHPELCLAGTFAASFARHVKTPYDAEALGRAFTAEMYGVEMPEFAAAALKAGRSFALGQAGMLVRAHRVFTDGRDPVADFVADLDNEHGGRAGALGWMRGIAADYAAARETFTQLRDRAARNADNFDYWLEGIDVNIFYADVILTSLGGSLTREAPALLQRLGVLRDATRALFTRTYLRHSVDEELALRYGFYQEYLRCLLPGGGGN